MPPALPVAQMTYVEYAASEAASPIRREFAGGQIYASLKEYVFVAQDEPRIEVYRRNDEGGWVLYEARSGQQLELCSVGVMLDVKNRLRESARNALGTQSRKAVLGVLPSVFAPKCCPCLFSDSEAGLRTQWTVTVAAVDANDDLDSDKAGSAVPGTKWDLTVAAISRKGQGRPREVTCDASWAEPVRPWGRFGARAALKLGFSQCRNDIENGAQKSATGCGITRPDDF